MELTLTTKCNALNWIIARIQNYWFEKDEYKLGKNLDGWHTWQFEGFLPEKMIKEIQGYIHSQVEATVDLRAPGKFYIDGYEFQVKLPTDKKVFIRVSLEVEA